MEYQIMIMEKVKLSLASLIITISSAEISAHSIACPDISQITEVGSSGIFRASDDQGEWLGSLSGVIKNDTRLKSFEMALVVQEKKEELQKLQYCSYRMEGELSSLNMRYSPKGETTYNVTTEGDAWKEEEGPFGLIYYVCENSSPENCRFTVNID